MFQRSRAEDLVTRWHVWWWGRRHNREDGWEIIGVGQLLGRRLDEWLEQIGERIKRRYCPHDRGAVAVPGGGLWCKRCGADVRPMP